ncbi:KUP/HAK/KT family potassium transporter [Muribaculum sp.]|uniref:KUP/HAK/KT family potassium transporter n=1 Tax=Muribaculum sp. TaxID=1918611 RepID=UPI0023CCA69F|nr:KUP/HAK/KT family potassium transporter [Muribaculum sp.]MDE5704886.1 KUP/HAK/KT family potassium transporter [Muribaculum sp.]
MKIANNRHTTSSSSLKGLSAMGLLIAVGIVFGDIGTSPLYVMKAITGVNPSFDADYIIGAVSCVIWVLTLQTTLKYVIIALRADNNGEGGILALFSLIKNLPKKRLYLIGAIGAAALIADGVITPAITVTSAIEGLSIITPKVPVTPIVVLIIIGIFILQQNGTGKIGRMFGPFMLAWFLMLGVLGACNIHYAPHILSAFNPWYAIKLLSTYPEWFLILGAVFLCTTGAEALYSDLGHCGRWNISISWIFVKISLIVNYLGQGAWLIGTGGIDGVNPFYGIMPAWFMPVGVAMSAGAAIIASQALLSGSFTIFSEAINLDFWPKLRIKYPSNEKGQLYIPAINWILLAGCMVTVFLFRDSSHMEAAYGLAITITMLMTTILLAIYLRHKGHATWICISFLVFFGVLESIFFAANAAKFTHGGWFTLLIAGMVALVMIIWYNSTRIRDSHIEFSSVDSKLALIRDLKNDNEVPRYASNIVYFSRSANPRKLENKLLYSIVSRQPKRADHYWIIHIERSDDPWRLDYKVDELIEDTMFFVTITMGFRVEPKISLYLRQVVEDLVKEGKVDITSSYPSLRRHGVAGDFRFVVINRLFSAESSCTRKDAMLLRMHDRLRHIGISDLKAMGLDTSGVVMESVPLIISTSHRRRIRRSDQSAEA